MTLKLKFKGFFECRLATDPDPSDDPNGVSGWTFRVPGEPPLDRIIRLQPKNAVQRWPCPPVGVNVWEVEQNGVAVPASPLLGAKVSFAANSFFNGQNGLVAKAGTEPVYPFEINVEGADFSITRQMNDKATGKPSLVLASGGGAYPELLSAVGIADPVAYRTARIDAINNRLQTEKDPKILAGLKKRKQWFDKNGPSPALMWGPVPAVVFVDYDYKVEFPDGQVTDPKQLLSGIDVSQPWNVTFSCGCWDADVLVGIISGTLELPDKVVA